MPVILKRFLAPLWVFIFGMSVAPPAVGFGGFGDCRLRCGSAAASPSRSAVVGRGLRPLVGRQDHDHVAAVELGRRLDLADCGDRLRRPGRGSACRARVADLPARNMIVILTLCPSSGTAPTLRVLVSKSPCADLEPVLHLLDGDVGRLAARLLGLLRGFVLELAVVHDPADRRVGRAAPPRPGRGPCSRAICSASGSGLMPSWSPSGSTRRTSRARMRSLILGSLVAGGAAMRHHSLGWHARTRNRRASESNARPGLAVIRPGRTVP